MNVVSNLDSVDVSCGAYVPDVVDGLRSAGICHEECALVGCRVPLQIDCTWLVHRRVRLNCAGGRAVAVCRIDLEWNRLVLPIRNEVVIAEVLVGPEWRFRAIVFHLQSGVVYRQIGFIISEALQPYGEGRASPVSPDGLGELDQHFLLQILRGLIP